MSALPDNVLPFSLKGKAEVHARDVARWLVGLGEKPEGLKDEAYLSRFRDRLQAGVLPSGVEQMVWHYACGKPTETIEATITDKSKLWALPDEKLAARIDFIMSRLKGTV